jgi:hypothetical protein
LSAVAIVALPVAAALVVVAGALTPSVDALTATVSRLAVPGLPAAAAVDAAIAATGIACVALAAASRRGRLGLVVAAAGFFGAAIVHLDPSSAASTAAHRLCAGIAILGLALAQLRLAASYGLVSVGLVAVGAALLVLAAALLTTTFTWWGLWERAFLAFELAWLELAAFKIAFSEDTASASAATLSRAGT